MPVTTKTNFGLPNCCENEITGSMDFDIRVISFRKKLLLFPPSFDWVLNQGISMNAASASPALQYWPLLCTDFIVEEVSSQKTDGTILDPTTMGHDRITRFYLR